MKAPYVFVFDNGLQPSIFLALTWALTIIPFVKENGAFLSSETETRQLGVWLITISESVPSHDAVSETVLFEPKK
jgi:hypothetical protein